MYSVRTCTYRVRTTVHNSRCQYIFHDLYHDVTICTRNISYTNSAYTSGTLARHDIVYKRPDIDICRYRHQDSTISCLRFWATISGTILSYDIEVSVFDIEYSKLRYRITQKWKNADIECFIYDIEACRYRINLRYRMFLAATISKNLRYRHKNHISIS